MSLFGVSVLVVEDEPQVFDLIKKILRERQPSGWSINYTIKNVATLAQAKNAIHAGGWDVILLDLKLPNGDGLRVLDDFQNAYAPVIVMTSFPDLDTMQEAIRKGAARYYSKHDILTNNFWLHYSIAASIESWRLSHNVQQMQEKMIGHLKNLISACSSCGNWCDPVQGKFLTPEKFLEKFNIYLTHTICSDCANRLYSEELNAANKPDSDE